MNNPSKEELEVFEKEQEKREFLSQKESILETLKPELNNFLWMRLPPNMTLDEAEDFACAIFEKIRDMWEEQENDK